MFLAGIPKGAILTHYGMVSTAMAGLQHIVSWIFIYLKMGLWLIDLLSNQNIKNDFYLDLLELVSLS